MSILSFSLKIKNIFEIAKEHGIDRLSDKKIVIFGAGPVARIAAILAAKLNNKTFIVETWSESSNNFIKKLAKELTKKAGERTSEIIGVFAITDAQKFEVIKNADIIWSLAAAGVEILSSKLLSKMKGKKIVVDINLVPPYGIKGLKPKDNNKEIHPGIFGTGALALGRLKSNTEASILKEAANIKCKKVFDYNYAFDIAEKLLFGSKVVVSH